MRCSTCHLLRFFLPSAHQQPPAPSHISLWEGGGYHLPWYNYRCWWQCAPACSFQCIIFNWPRSFTSAADPFKQWGLLAGFFFFYIWLVIRDHRAGGEGPVVRGAFVGSFHLKPAVKVSDPRCEPEGQTEPCCVVFTALRNNVQRGRL